MSDVGEVISFRRIELWVSLLGAFTLVGGIVYWIGTIAAQININTEHLRAIDARLNALEVSERSDQLDLTKLVRDQNQIATQFCGDDTIRNLMHSNELRVEAMLWQKVFSTNYPTDNAYYPTLCQKSQ